MSDPLGFSNCLLWLDANDTSTLTLNGRRVSSWVSKGLCNMTFIPGGQQYTGTIGAPLYVPTSRAVYFDNGDYQSSDTYPDSSGLQMCNANVNWPDSFAKTVYAVVNILNGTTTIFNSVFQIQSVNPSAISYFMYVTGPSNTGYQYMRNGYNGVSSNLSYGSNIQPYTTTVLTHRSDFVNNDAQQIYLNGSLINSAAISRAQLGVDASVNRVALGAGYGNTYTGYLHELLYYNAYHTEQQRQQVEAYLTAKWKPSIQLKTYFPLYQYVPIDPIYVAADGKGPVYLFIQPTDLPVGLIYNPLTQDISGKSVRAGAESTTVYAVDDAGTTTLGLNFQTDFPVVKRTFGNAGNYTSYVRQYTLANAAQNARDRFVLAEDTGLGAFTAPYPPDVVTQTVDPKCYSTSNCP
jgi:hypothetical protein